MLQAPWITRNHRRAELLDNSTREPRVRRMTKVSTEDAVGNESPQFAAVLKISEILSLLVKKGQC